MLGAYFRLLATWLLFGALVLRRDVKLPFRAGMLGVRMYKRAWASFLQLLAETCIHVMEGHTCSRVAVTFASLRKL